MTDSNPQKSPLISVIICCYGGEKTIEACLDSLLHQELDNDLFEVVIVDDGSYDSSAELIKRFIENRVKAGDPEYRYFRKVNEGLSIARNFGLENSRSDLVVYIDEDAYAYPEYLKVIVDYFANNKDVNCLGGEVELYNEDNEFAKLVQDSFFSVYMKDKGSIIGTNMAYRKSFLLDVGGFQPEFTYRGDETALFAKSKETLVKGRAEQMKVKHFQPVDLKAWMKTRYENGFFKIAIHFFTNKPHSAILLNILMSIALVGVPFMIVGALVSAFFSLHIALTLSVSAFVILFRKFLWNGALTGVIKELRANRKGKSKVLDELYVTYMVIAGEYRANVGYIKGYSAFKNIVWKK